MDVLGQLRIIGLLSQDRVVRQLAAHDPDGRPVLLTVGQAPLHQGEPEAYAAWAERLTTCSSHPHIAEVFTYGVADGRAYLAVRTGERRTLAELLATTGPLHPEHVRVLGAAIADAIATAHQAQLWHLAVRPEVIFVDNEENPVLVGFDSGAPGLVRPMATGPLSAPEYRVPRGALDGQGPMVGGPADVYALGATLYRALGGWLPWVVGPYASAAPPPDAGTAASITDMPASEHPGAPKPGGPPACAPVDEALRSAPLPDLPAAPSDLVETLRRAVAPHPAQRLTAAQLREELLAPPRRSRRPGPEAAADPSEEALAIAGSVAMLAATAAPQQPDPQEEPRGVAAPAPPDQPVEAAHDAGDLRPLVGTWRITGEAGEQEWLMVDAKGAVTWTGSDEVGPFLATGEAVPTGEDAYRLLLNEPAGQAGFYVDLKITAGGLSFDMDDAPADGMVAPAAGE